MADTNRPPLSPAAQAVYKAVLEICPAPADEIAAAALRAVADWDETLFDVDEERMPPVRAVRTARLLAIAAELEGTHD